jgi:prepilin-type N-terminal cleavage/methylation domain-containing protein
VVLNNRGSSFLTFKRGFSILEMSMVLLVIGVIVASFVSVMGNRNNIARQRETLQEMAIIEAALTQFVLQNNRLPCPAMGSISTSNTNFGIETCNGADDLSVLVAPTPTSYSSNTAAWVIGGTVPINTLKLPKSYMFDGWNNRYTYAVSKPLAANVSNGSVTATYGWQSNNMGIIKVKDITGATRTDQAAYVLISHGPNGFGAWPYNGGTRISFPSSPNSSEVDNSHVGAAWDESFVTSEPNGSFDDIVHYRMKWQILGELGLPLSNSLCDTAKTVLQTADVTSSSVGYSAYCNTMPVDSNCASFLNTIALKIRDLCLSK